MSYFTITLKLHKPGREKRRILEEAMSNYTKAFDFLILEAKKHRFDPEDYRKSGNYKLSSWISQDLNARLNQFHVEPFKDSLKLDFAMTFSSYLELKSKGKKVGFPSINTDSEGNLKNLRSIFFCRYDINRDYCLLYDARKCRYFVKIYLLNYKSARENPDTTCKEGKLEYVHKSRLSLENSVSKSRFIIVPLSFGKWQEKYLKQCLDNPERLKTARLSKRGEEYFISVNLNLPAKEKVNTDSFMGISRGPENSVCFTITDITGNVKESDNIHFIEGFDSNGKVRPRELHHASNKIVYMALANRSQVILENLKERNDGIFEVDFALGEDQSILNRSCYLALGRILEYKLEYAGLPKPVRVSPFGIFSTCPRCGLNTKRSRSSKGMFLCISCGAAYSIRSLGSLNLANKLLKYSTDDIKIKVTKEGPGIRLSNELLGLNLLLPEIEGLMVHLDRAIKEIIRETKKNKSQALNLPDFKKKLSMIQKIESFDDFTKHIIFIQK